MWPFTSEKQHNIKTALSQSSNILKPQLGQLSTYYLEEIQPESSCSELAATRFFRVAAKAAPIIYEETPFENMFFPRVFVPFFRHTEENTDINRIGNLLLYIDLLVKDINSLE